MTSLDSPSSADSYAARREALRGKFPALANPLVFLENAGGAQVPATVPDRISRYMRETYVQLGAPYALSEACTSTVSRAHDLALRMLNGEGAGLAVLGASTTALCNMVAASIAQTIEPGDEFVIAEIGHEANVGPWDRLSRLGAVIRTWPFDLASGSCRLEDLEPLLGPRTRLVAVPHVSNLLGEVVDVKGVADRAHAVGAEVFVDGVAFAPHRAVDVQAFDSDFYVVSLYKVYAPHLAAMFVRQSALERLVHPNHYFIGPEEGAYAFEPGGVSHEACAGLLGLGDYLAWLGDDQSDAQSNDGLPLRGTIEAAFGHMAELESPLIHQLVDGLQSIPGVTLVGPGVGGADRVGTVSFVHERRRSRAIAESVCEAGIAIRYGHMYAHRLSRRLGLDDADGVVRISLVHYNSAEEVGRAVEAVRAAVLERS